MHRFEAPLAVPCAHCGSEAVQAFCPQCGQARARRLDARQIGREWTDQLEALDFALVRTLRGLLRAPGATIRGYLAGNRQPYTTPGKCFFLLTTLAVAITLALPLPLLPVADTAAVSAEMGEWIVQLQAFIFASRAYLQPLILLPVAWVVARLWRGSGIGVAEAYVVLMYAFALLALVQLLVAISVALWHPPALAAARLIGTGLVLVWLLHDVFADRLHRDVLRGLVVFAAYVPLSMAVMIPAYLLLRLFGVELGAH